MSDDSYLTLKSELARICTELRKPELEEEENWMYGSTLVMDAARKVGEFVIREPEEAGRFHLDGEMHDMLEYVMQETPRYFSGDRKSRSTIGRIGFEFGH